MQESLRVLTIGMFALALTSSVAFGGVIDFATLTGSNLDSFTTYTQNNFTVNATTGSWFKAFAYGNPVPDIFLGPIGAITSGSIAVTSGTGLFSFGSVDFSSNNGISAYSIQGFRGGLLQFTQSGTQANSCTGVGCAFSTLASTSSLAIDTLVVGITWPGFGPSSFNVDNIVVNSVPEPGTFVLLCLAGLLGASIQPKRTRKE